MPNVIRFLRGDKKDIPRLKAGQPAFTLDTNEFFVGNGTTNIKFLNETDINRASDDEAIEGLDNTKLITPKTLKVAIKANGGGGGIINNVFITGVSKGKFTATEVTDRFTIPNMDTSKEVSIIYKNLILNEDEEYTLAKNTGNVILSFNLEIGEEIFYEMINTSYDYKELIGTPDIVNNLDETIVGNVLDATQGKVLLDIIQELTVRITELENLITHTVLGADSYLGTTYL